MKVYLVTMVDQDIISDQSAYENAQDALWNGLPYKDLDEAKASCQQDVLNFWAAEEKEPVLAWEEQDFGGKYKALSAKCQELGFEFLIRTYEL